MANAKKKARGKAQGRVTPKGTVARQNRARARTEQPLPQVGRRPSRPGLLLAIGILWAAAGIFALLNLHAAWKLIPGIVFIGIGILYLRAAGTAYLRQTGRA
ncbi:MAG TPA: hypothetical protein VFA94_04085 [Acidimicrobiales bacterium]|nr:hypothetical protein [Acidimicrobiales bacterium]